MCWKVKSLLGSIKPFTYSKGNTFSSWIGRFGWVISQWRWSLDFLFYGGKNLHSNKEDKTSSNPVDCVRDNANMSVGTFILPAIVTDCINMKTWRELFVVTGTKMKLILK